MSWFFSSPEPGDWIKTTELIKVTFTDHLMGVDGGIKAGTRGLITRSLGCNTLEAKLDTGLFGSVTVRVKPNQVRVIRRHGGTDAYTQTMSRIKAARAGVAIVLIAPVLWSIVAYLLRGGSTADLGPAIVSAIIDGVLDLMDYALVNPINAVLYVVVLTAAARFAFGR